MWLEEIEDINKDPLVLTTDPAVFTAPLKALNE